MANGRIFISYRRGHDNGEARSLYYQLERYFDRDQLFMDVDNIPAGVDFVDYLDGQVAQCNALIAIIGRGWVAGVARLHDEEDFVRVEIGAALARQTQIPIIPLLVDDCALPAKQNLPDLLHPLCRRNGVSIRHDIYAQTIEARLIPALSAVLEMETSPEPKEPLLARSDDLQAPVVARPEPSQPQAPTPVTMFRDVDECWCPEMVEIPAGMFRMGTTLEESASIGSLTDICSWERPQHDVEINQTFALARYATTFEEFDAFCMATGHTKPADENWGRGRRPVVNVDWHDAVAYCEWLSAKTGHTYRLPFEAEWEYACRAGSMTAYTFGENASSLLANYGGERSKTLPVDFPEFQPNAFGLHQMPGNVWEWCADDFLPGYESPRHQHMFLADPRSDTKVVRGGSWSSPMVSTRSGNRGGHVPELRTDDSGFRLARTPLNA